MEFSVTIPSADADGFDIALEVSADNWMQALKLGLERTGGDRSQVKNIICDIQEDQVIQVTDLASRRVFKIRQLDEPRNVPERIGHKLARPERGFFRHPQEFPAISTTRTHSLEEDTEHLPAVSDSGAPPPSADEATERLPALPEDMQNVAGPTRLAVATPPGRGERVLKTAPAIMKTGQPLVMRSVSGVFCPIGSFDLDSARVGDLPARGRILHEIIVPTRSRLPALSFIEDADAEGERIAQTGIEEVFLEISTLFEGQKTLDQVTAFALDLAMGHISAESGSVLYADHQGKVLSFAAVRGPKAQRILDGDFTIPLTRGFAGFSAREGVTVAASDVSRDSRFYGDIAESIGYAVKNLLVAPIEYRERSYGVIELLNHRRRDVFSPSESNILTYIGSQIGRFISQLLGTA